MSLLYGQPSPRAGDAEREGEPDYGSYNDIKGVVQGARHAGGVQQAGNWEVMRSMGGCYELFSRTIVTVTAVWTSLLFYGVNGLMDVSADGRNCTEDDPFVLPLFQHAVFVNSTQRQHRGPNSVVTENV